MSEPGEHSPNRLRELRNARQLSLRELSEKSGVDFNAINRIELRQRGVDLDTLRQLGDALGVKISELLCDEDVELRAELGGRKVLESLRDVPAEALPDLVEAARQTLRVSAALASRRNGHLAGNPTQLSQLARIWNSSDDTQRGRALEILKLTIGS